MAQQAENQQVYHTHILRRKRHLRKADRLENEVKKNVRILSFALPFAAAYFLGLSGLFLGSVAVVVLFLVTPLKSSIKWVCGYCHSRLESRHLETCPYCHAVFIKRPRKRTSAKPPAEEAQAPARTERADGADVEKPAARADGAEVEAHPGRESLSRRKRAAERLKDEDGEYVKPEIIRKGRKTHVSRLQAAGFSEKPSIIRKNPKRRAGRHSSE